MHERTRSTIFALLWVATASMLFVLWAVLGHASHQLAEAEERYLAAARESNELRISHDQLLERTNEIIEERDRLMCDLDREERRWRLERRIAAEASGKVRGLEDRVEEIGEALEVERTVAEGLRIELNGARAVNEALLHDLEKCKAEAKGSDCRRCHTCHGG